MYQNARRSTVKRTLEGTWSSFSVYQPGSSGLWRLKVSISNRPSRSRSLFTDSFRQAAMQDQIRNTSMQSIRESLATKTECRGTRSEQVDQTSNGVEVIARPLQTLQVWVTISCAKSPPSSKSVFSKLEVRQRVPQDRNLASRARFKLHSVVAGIFCLQLFQLYSLQI